MLHYAPDVEHPVVIPSDKVTLEGLIYVPESPKGLVLFVHGSGSSRFSVRNQYVARVLQKAGLATLLFDLFTPEEEAIDDRTRKLRFDIEFLANRLISATRWIETLPIVQNLPVGYFGASTGGGAAIVAGAKEKRIKAIVSRGGRPDLAKEALASVKAPTLLIVGGDDDIVIELNQKALQELNCIKQLEIVPGATHLFEEPGTLEQVALLANNWFLKYLV
ncbi:MAG: dienelactone hydrolase family protein [Gammaproteobacteria bacterium]